jgi:hypothetical protein
MLSTRVFGLACAVAVLSACWQRRFPRSLSTSARYLHSVGRTLSGVTLPGGQYLFRLADPNSSSNPFDYVGVRHAGSLFTRNAWRTRATARR